MCTPDSAVARCRLATNLITYLRQEMGEQPAFAAIMVQLFEGTCYMTPLLGAWLADSHWGRYKTILVFSAIYMLVSGRVWRRMCPELGLCTRLDPAVPRRPVSDRCSRGLSLFWSPDGPRGEVRS